MDEAKSFKTPCKQYERNKSEESMFGTPASVMIPASPFMKMLGYGTGVSVYLMKRSPKGLSKSPWAVKKINAKLNNIHQDIYEQRLHEEASILKNLQHPNIVGYRAFTKAKDGSMCLAMEYGGDMSLNDLIELKQEKEEGPFPAATIMKVALHMARGLKYLHNEKKLLHGDIKSTNVVIKGDFETIKICDVGVSLLLDENMIDESFDEDDFDDDAYYEALGTRPPLNMEELDESYQKVIELFSVCTNEDAKERPSAAQIVEVVEAQIQE
uniref:Lymphokine-activated killer T-cell-originated protein kinase isoform X2 n=1 Tax=Geotrypetes seraphini TaxID=260995 RepID=A0A6P8QUY2_GEOSA|nr:lymphokine-activated killer T-cell-originated protein kinase isoform X2 [Geotrypetes seraphini]